MSIRSLCVTASGMSLTYRGAVRGRGALTLVPAAVLAALSGALVAQRQSLWYDELYTAEVGTAGLGALARAVVEGTGTTPYLADVPPSYNGPYYAVVHVWLALTPLRGDDVGLRLLSLVAAAAAVAVLARAVQRLAGPAVGLAAGLLAATSPLVVEYGAEARGYGLALLATAVTSLGLARWLDGAPRGLALYAAGATATGLMHWLALPVVGALAVVALAVRRRAAVPVLVVSVLAALPTLALVALAYANGTGTSVVGHIEPGQRLVPRLALEAWAGGSGLLAGALLVALAAGVGRRTRASLLGGAWLLLPLLAIQVVDLVRPVYVARYLLPALLGVAVLAAVGAAGGRWRVPLTGALVVGQVVAAAPLLDREPREDGAAAVTALARLHEPGQPVVAADRRAALALDHYAPDDVRPDLVLPPQDPTGEDDVVWVLRQSQVERTRESDDDAVLAGAGLRPEVAGVFLGRNSDLLLQRWSR